MALSNLLSPALSLQQTALVPMVRHSRGGQQLPELALRSLDLAAMPHLWQLLSDREFQVMDGTDTIQADSRKEWIECLSSATAGSTMLIPLLCAEAPL